MTVTLYARGMAHASRRFHTAVYAQLGNGWVATEATTGAELRVQFLPTLAAVVSL